MSKIGDKRFYPRRMKYADIKENKEEVKEALLIDQENEGIVCRIKNNRIPVSE